MIVMFYTRNGGCRQEGKSCKHCSLSTIFLFMSMPIFFFFIKLGTIVCIDGTAKTQKNMPTHLDSLSQLGVAFQTGIERRPVPQAPRWLLHISSSARDGDTSPRRTKRFRTHIRSNCTHARPLIDG